MSVKAANVLLTVWKQHSELGAEESVQVTIKSVKEKYGITVVLTDVQRVISEEMYGNSIPEPQRCDIAEVFYTAFADDVLKSLRTTDPVVAREIDRQAMRVYWAVAMREEDETDWEIQSLQNAIGEHRGMSSKDSNRLWGHAVVYLMRQKKLSGMDGEAWQAAWDAATSATIQHFLENKVKVTAQYIRDAIHRDGERIQSYGFAVTGFADSENLPAELDMWTEKELDHDLAKAYPQLV